MASYRTVKNELSSGHVSSSGILGDTLVQASILRAEIWDLQDPVGVVDFDLAREGAPICASPRDGRHRTEASQSARSPKPSRRTSAIVYTTFATHKRTKKTIRQ